MMEPVPKAWELSHGKLPQHVPVAVWVPAAALRVSECLHVDTHFIKPVPTVLFGIPNSTFIYAAFHPSCINVAVKRK